MSGFSRFKILFIVIAGLLMAALVPGERSQILRAQDSVDSDSAGMDIPTDLSSEVDRIMGRIGKRHERLWTYAYELRELAGDDAQDRSSLVSLMASYIENPDPYVQIVACYISLVLDDDSNDTIIEVLVDLLRDAQESDVVASAARLLLSFEPDDVSPIVEAIESRLERSKELEPVALTVLAEVEALLAPDGLGVERLRGFLSSDSRELMNRSALSLARLGHTDDVQGRLDTLRKESGSLAVLAALTLTIASTEGDIKNAREGAKKDAKADVVADVIRHVYTGYNDDYFYHGEERQKLTVQNLLDNAGRGMVGSVDPFSEYLTAEEMQRFNEDAGGSFVGIGANVTKGEGDEGIKIAQPFYEGPAYKAGLRSGDMAWEYAECDGETIGPRISLRNIELLDVVKLLRGKEGTRIKLWVKRPGVTELVELEITRTTVNVDTALESMFPGDIGYVNLTRFGERSDVDMFESLQKLQRLKMKGLIIDLRDNPGGSLPIVMRIAELFLPKGVPVVKLEGVWENYEEPQILSTTRTPAFGDLPVVVLIDESSASGAELLSGALKDHKRALVIGEKSFGKGIGQGHYPVMGQNLKNEVENPAGRILKCTVFRYFVMPSGISVDRKDGEGGVTPDIEVSPKLYSSWEFYKLADLQKSEHIDRWVLANWEKHKNLFMELAEYDGYSEAKYPGFDDLYKSLNTELPRDMVRNEVRRVIRTRAADERAYPYFGSYQIDYQLQRAIIELAAKIKVDPATIPNYEPFIFDHPRK